jgi:hypothetical protein
MRHLSTPQPDLEDMARCTMCMLPQLANAYDHAGKSDSAIAIFERYLMTPDLAHVTTDAQYAAAELQPQVTEVRKRIARLRATRG